MEKQPSLMKSLALAAVFTVAGAGSLHAQDLPHLAKGDKIKQADGQVCQVEKVGKSFLSSQLVVCSNGDKVFYKGGPVEKADAGAGALIKVAATEPVQIAQVAKREPQPQ